MKYRFLRNIALIGVLCIGLFSTSSCSHKTGCPAEDAGFETDKQGNIKIGKTRSGLLPPKGKKRKKPR